jgi:hypothetical protein
VNLIDAMMALADSGHPMAADLRERAKALADAIERWDARATVGAWARARRTMYRATGDKRWSLFGVASD